MSYTHISKRGYQVTGKILRLRKLFNTSGNSRWLIAILPDTGPSLVYHTRRNIQDAYHLSEDHVGRTATLTIDRMEVINIELKEEK